MCTYTNSFLDKHQEKLFFSIHIIIPIPFLIETPCLHSLVGKLFGFLK